MKILFLTTDDILRNASSNIRNVSLINGLIKLKHDVTIVSLCHGHAADNGLEKAIAGSRLIVLGGTARSK